MKIRLFESFAGYGSQTMALERLKRKHPDFDYEVVGYSEIDPNAIRLHDACHPNCTNYGDISKIDWEKVPDFDLFTMSSPCQDFSQAGLQMGGAEGSGTRSSLLWECRRAIAEKRPKYILFENVEALVQDKFIKYFNKWRSELESYGYDNYAKVINAADCGVPQNRRRIFMLSIRNDGRTTDFHFPRKKKLEKRLKDVLESDVDEKYYLNDGLLSDMGGYVMFKGKKIYDGDGLYAETTKNFFRAGLHGISRCLKAAMHDASVCVREPIGAAIRTRSDGEWAKGEKHTPKVELGKDMANAITSVSKDSLVVLGDSRDEKGVVVSYHVKGESNTVTGCTGSGGNTDMFVHDKSRLRIRRLTPRECFRLMDVDEEYIDRMTESGVSKSGLCKAAGNSIVVACMEGIFEECFFPKGEPKVADDGQLCLF